MARTKAEIKAWEHEMAQRATEQLSALADTRKFKQYLRQNAAFHGYSVRNVLLINMQHPNATRVAGFKQWDKLGRHIRKGEHAIKITMPIVKKLTSEEQVKYKTTAERAIVGYRYGSVFDVSQTNGKALLSATDFIKERLGDHQNVERLYHAVVDAINTEGHVKVSEAPIDEPGVRGFFRPSTQEIVISPQETDAAMKLKTLFHEYGHSQLHGIGQAFADRPRAWKEAQAESVAYIAMQNIGIDTGDYSLGYVATWAKDPKVMAQALKEINEASVHTIELSDQAAQALGFDQAQTAEATLNDAPEQTTNLNSGKRERLTQSEIDRARKLSLVEIARSAGIDLKEDSRDYYRGVDHDSLVIDTKKNLWKWNSQNLGGGAIEFATTFLDQKGFYQAVKFLNAGHYDETKIQTAPKSAYHNYLKRADSFDRARDYLTIARGINPHLVDRLYQKGLIFQDSQNNLIFQWARNGKAVGASIQGTEIDFKQFGKRGTQKKIAANSQSDFGFNFSLGKPHDLYVFESPIDALSYWTQHPELTNCMIASVDGTKVESVVNMAVNMYKTKGQLPATIYVGSDNDPAGHQLYDKLQDSLLANTEAEVTTFKPLFPQDNAITQTTYQGLKQAADQAGIDWRELAAAVKATTNLSTNFQQSFPLPQAIAKSSVLIDPNPGKTNFNSDEALLTAAKFIKANRTSDNEPDWDAITKKLNPGIEDHDREHLAAKSSYYNTRYQADNGILPVTKIAKDWNELAKLAQHPATMDQQLEQTYRRQDGKTAKLIANGQDQFSLVDRQQPDKVVGFFEANNPQQCAYLIKQYGYNAVDKEDEQKYQQTQPVKPQHQQKKQRASGLEQSI